MYWNEIKLLRSMLIFTNTFAAIYWLLAVAEVELLMPDNIERSAQATALLLTFSLVLVALLAGFFGQRRLAQFVACALLAAWCWGAYQLVTNHDIMRPPVILAVTLVGGLSSLFTVYALTSRRNG